MPFEDGKTILIEGGGSISFYPYVNPFPPRGREARELGIMMCVINAHLSNYLTEAEARKVYAEMGRAIEATFGSPADELQGKLSPAEHDRADFEARR